MGCSPEASSSVVRDASEESPRAVEGTPEREAQDNFPKRRRVLVRDASEVPRIPFFNSFSLLLTLCSGFRLPPGPSSWRERKSVRKNPNPALLAAASLLLLAGCQTASVDMPNPFKSA